MCWFPHWATGKYRDGQLWIAVWAENFVLLSSSKDWRWRLQPPKAENGVGGDKSETTSSNFWEIMNGFSYMSSWFRFQGVREWFRLEETLKTTQFQPWAGTPPPDQVSQSPVHPGLCSFKIPFICASHHASICCVGHFHWAAWLLQTSFQNEFKGIYFGALWVLPLHWSWFSTSPDKKMDKAPFPQCVMDRADSSSLYLDSLWIARK